MSYAGRQLSGAWFDEMSNHTVDAFSYMAQSMSGPKFVGFDPATGLPPSPPPKPTITPIELECASCGAAKGERCNRGRDPRTLRVRYRGLHFRRKHDAQLATEAVRALNPA